MFKPNLKLNEIAVGKRAIVKKINSNESIKRRLLDRCLTPGSKIDCVLSSPSGDPKAYLIKGALIAIRNEDSNMIIVEAC